MGLHLITGAGLTLMLTIALISAMIDIAMGDSNKDREECAEQLAGLATCLPYVGGNAKAPTPDCCNGLKQVLKDNKKCLCVIIRDRNDPGLGLKINVTLALGLPSVCHATANVSQCPALLHMDPNAPDAQVFYQFASASSPALSPAEEGNPTSGSSQGQSAQKISDGGNSKSRLEIFSLGLGISLWYFFYLQLFT